MLYVDALDFDLSETLYMAKSPLPNIFHDHEINGFIKHCRKRKKC